MPAPGEDDSAGGVSLAGALRPIARRRPPGPAPAPAAAQPAQPAELPPEPRPAEAQPPGGRQEAGPAPAPRAAARAERGPRPRRYQPARRRPGADSGWKSVPLYLPPGLLAELNRRAGPDEKSKPKVLFDALIATRDRMPALLAAMHAAMQPPKAGPFIYPQAPAAGPPKDNTSIRMRSANKEALDDMVWESRARTRTEYITLALETYFADTGWERHLAG